MKMPPHTPHQNLSREHARCGRPQRKANVGEHPQGGRDTHQPHVAEPATQPDAEGHDEKLESPANGSEAPSSFTRKRTIRGAAADVPSPDRNIASVEPRNSLDVAT
ncbi:hypothetical protein [Paraburkholderia sp. EG304]|uniref:hypothetical protein n=1 Tax=Paraburkholderia sp. EG304 TaxID=3237015 RepID=UPI003978B20E